MAGIKINWEEHYKSYKAERMKELVDKLGSNMVEACLIVERQAKKNASKSAPAHPQRQTGRLVASITSQTSKEGDKIVGGVGTNVEYGAALEFGHGQEIGRYVPAIGKKLVAGSVPPYPWLFPALEEKKGEVERALGK